MNSAKLTTVILVWLLFAAFISAGADEINIHPLHVPDTQFSYTDEKAKAVFLAAEFNNWNTTATPMKRDGSGKWTVSVSLVPGRYNYKFVVDGRWVQDFANPDSGPDGHGGKNSIVTVRNPFADPVVEEKNAVRNEAARLFGRSDFAALEKKANELRQTRERFSDGLWKLKEFYDELQAEKEMSDRKDWKPWFDKLQTWREKFPESITAPVVEARGWTDYAWEARGTGYVNTVKKEGWKLFEERLAKAREILETATKLPARCPNWYGVMQTVALGQGWERRDADKLLSDAAKAEPTYYDFYWGHAYALLPRWYGERGDWEHFAEEAARKFDPGEGMSAYTRTAWFMITYYNNLFTETKIEWPKMKQGFLDIEKSYPNSRWNVNGFCRFAVMAHDRDTADKLFNQIGEHGDPNWGGYARYELARRWADPQTPRWQVEPVNTMVEGSVSRGAIHALAFSSDGKFLACGGAGGQVNIWQASNGESIWSEKFSPDTVMSVAFSPDGKLVAAGAGEEHQTTHSGIVKVWNVQAKTEVASARPAGTVWSIAFTPDGGTLAVSGGQFNRQAEASLLDISTGKLTALTWTKDHDHGLHAVAISPDGQVLATDCYQSITVWSLADNKILFDTRNSIRTFTQALVFSPDGKTLLAAGTPTWAHHNNEPGGLTFWDTTTWKTRPMPEQSDAAGLYTVAYSPDGKWIAGAGQDQAVHVWDAGTLKPVAIYIGHDGPIYAVAFSPDGKNLASGSDDGTIKIWKLPSSQ